MKDLKFFIVKDGHAESNNFRANMIHPKAVTTSTVPRIHHIQFQFTSNNSSLSKKKDYIVLINGWKISQRCNSHLIQINKRQEIISHHDGSRSYAGPSN